MRYFPTGANGIASGNIAQLLSLSLSRAAGEGSRARRARKTNRNTSAVVRNGPRRCCKTVHARGPSSTKRAFTRSLFGAFAERQNGPVQRGWHRTCTKAPPRGNRATGSLPLRIPDGEEQRAFAN